jgi:hypothetical protein
VEEIHQVELVELEEEEQEVHHPQHLELVLQEQLTQVVVEEE